jgi:DNA invertase Pin-like site-specific DNA recombinase
MTKTKSEKTEKSKASKVTAPKPKAAKSSPKKVSSNPSSATQLNAALYARVSIHEEQTLPMQLKQMREYVKGRGWKISHKIEEIGSDAKTRPQREEILKFARQKKVDVIVIWRFDRWGRSVADLMVTLRELTDIGVGFVSLTEEFDSMTPSGKAMAATLAVFAGFERDVLRERVTAGMAKAREQGKPHGRPPTALNKLEQIRKLKEQGMKNTEIARHLKIGRSSVIRLLK